MNLCVNAFIKKLISLPDNLIVLTQGNNQYTAGQLKQDSLNAALYLRSAGVNEHDIVVLLVKPGIDFVRLLYAQFYLGTKIAFVDPQMGQSNFESKIKQLEPKHIFIDNTFLFLHEHPLLFYLINKFLKPLVRLPYSSSYQLFSINDKLPIFRKHKNVRWVQNFKSNYSLHEADDDIGILITYTSGTLSEPKAVLHSPTTIIHSMDIFDKMLSNANNLNVVTHLAQYIFIGMHSKLHVVVWDNNWPPKTKFNFIIKNNITTLFGPPSDFMPLINFCKEGNIQFPNTIKQILLGSAPIHRNFLIQLVSVCPNVNIVCLYGMTELLMISSVDALTKINTECQGDLLGKPHPNVDVKIVNDGELCFNSPQKFLEYYNLKSAALFHHSGDLGFLDSMGNIVLTGRSKNMIIRSHFNIYPELYESTITQIDGVVDCAMIGIYSEVLHDQIVVLVIECKDKISADFIKKEISSGKHRIDQEALPDKILFAKLPRSGRSNKVDRKILMEQILSEWID